MALPRGGGGGVRTIVIGQHNHRNGAAHQTLERLGQVRRHSDAQFHRRECPLQYATSL